MKFSELKHPVSRKIIAPLAMVVCMLLPTNANCQEESATETDDVLIVAEEMTIDSDVELSVFGNLTMEVGSRIVNNGEVILNADDEYKEVNNFASDSAFGGQGVYSFQGKKDHYLTGDFTTTFYNLFLQKQGLNSALISEVPEIRILNNLELNYGVLDVEEGLVRIENADSSSLTIPEFLYIYSFINGRLVRRVNNGTKYSFPISSSNVLRTVRLTNNFSDVKYMDVSFQQDDIDLSAEFGIQYGISRFEGLDQTGVWKILADTINSDGSMDMEAYIQRFRGYDSYKDNMFGLMHSEEIESDKQDWQIEGDMEYYNSPYRKASTQTTKLRNAEQFGYYAVGIAERQKFANLIAPGGGRETRFIIQGLNPINPDQSQYDVDNCELVLYNIFGAEVWRKKPYENDLDLKEFQDGTYYYQFSFTINGKPGSIQSYIDVKRMD